MPLALANEHKVYYAFVGFPKSLLKRFEDSTGIMQTFWSPTTKAPDEEAV